MRVGVVKGLTLGAVRLLAALGGAAALVPRGVDSGQSTGLLVALTAASGLAAGFVAGRVARRVGGPAWLTETALVSMTALHVAGHVLGLYWSVPMYDSWLHLVGGVVAGAVGVAWAIGSDVLFAEGGANPWRVALAAVGVSSVLSVGVELAEFASDAFLGTEEQTHPVRTPLEDTMADLAASMAGGLAAAAGGAVRVRAAPREVSARSVGHGP